MLIARELLSSCEFHRFETLSTGVRTARYKRLSDAPHSDHSPTHTTVANISESVSTTAIDVKLSSDPTSTLSTCATESFYLSTYIIPQATKVHRNALQPKAIGSTVLTPVRHKPSKLSTTITNKENQNSHSNLQMKSTDIKGTTKETNHQPSTTSTSTSTDRVTSNSPNRGLQTQVVKSCDSAIVNIHVPWVESPYSVVCTRRVCNETPVTEESDLKHNLLSMTYDGGETETVDYTSEQKESDKVIESPYHSNISSSRIFYDKTSDLSDQRCADIWNVQLQSPDENSSVFSKANANLHEDRKFVIHKLEKNKKKSNTFVSPASDDSLEYKFYGNQRVVVSRKSF